MVHISLAGDQIYSSKHIFKEITLTAAASSTIKFVFVIRNSKFVRNLKLRAVTGEPNTWRHDIRRVYFNEKVMIILSSVHETAIVIGCRG